VFSVPFIIQMALYYAKKKETNRISQLIAQLT